MKNTLCTIMCLFILLPLSAQKASIKWGESSKTPAWKRIQTVIGNEEIGYFGTELNYGDLRYAVGGGPKNPYKNKNVPILNLYHFDSQLKLVKTRELKLGEKGKIRKLERLIVSNNRLYLFSSLLETKIKTNTLFLEELDVNSLETISEARKISILKFPKSKLQYMGGLAFKNSVAGRALVGFFGISFNADSSKILVNATEASPDGKIEHFNSTRGEFIMFNADMEELWRTGKDVFPVEAYHDSGIMNIGKEGNLYLFSSTLTEKERKSQWKSKRKSKSFRYKLYAYDAATKKSITQENAINTGQRKLQYLYPSLTPKNEMVIVGTYSRTDEKQHMERSYGGSFFIKIDLKTQKVLTEKMEDFPLSFIAEAREQKLEKLQKEKSKGKTVEIDNMFYTPKKVIIEPDGGATFISEGWWTSSGPGENAKIQWVDASIWLIKFKPDGSRDWSEFIAKTQRFQGDFTEFGSFIYVSDGEKKYFIFNDNPKNLQLTNGVVATHLTKPSASSIAVISVDKEGKMSKHFISSQKSSKIAIVPGASFVNEEGEIVFAGQFLRTRKVGKISLP